MSTTAPVKEKVVMELPREFYANVSVEAGTVVINPVGKRRGNMSIADIVTTDEDGKEHRFQVMLNRKTGQLKTQCCDDTPPKPARVRKGSTAEAETK